MATRVGGERQGSDITIASGEQSLRAYLAVPASDHGPGIVVVQEWWGLVDHIRDVCDRLAREGFVALAPDLYRGESASEPDAASRLMLNLEIPRAESDLSAAVSALLDHSAVDGARVGCIGFCMGGQLALCAAAKDARIGAVVDCYGIHPKAELDPAELRAAVFGIFAENDAFVSAASARALEAELKQAGVRARFHFHVGVQHAFMNDSRPDAYDAASAAEAWNELLAFLHAELAA